MKKLTLLLLFVGVVGFGQTQEASFAKPKPVTTEKEYNFLTKGLKIQLESGLDIIEGYEFENLQNLKVDNYTFDFKYLKEKSTQERKAISVIIESGATKAKYYVCIPVRNNKLSSLYAAYVNEFGIEMSKKFAVALGVVTADALTF